MNTPSKRRTGPTRLVGPACSPRRPVRTPHQPLATGKQSTASTIDAPVSATPPQLKFKVQGPRALKDMLLDLGWEEWDAENDHALDYNLWWKITEFRPFDIQDNDHYQRLNHFKGSIAICKKDTLARMLRKMIGIYGRVFNFFPQSFILPKDKDKFSEFYLAEKASAADSGAAEATWICKPSSGAQGRGIYLFREQAELNYRSSCVVQRYLDRPLLIEGYKFDLRIYVAVTSYHPLTVYMYRDGLARFSTQKYDLSDLSNQYAHLTNTSINKKSSTVDEDKGIVGAGCKWTLGQLRAWMRGEGINDGVLWQEICSVCVLTLLAAVPDIQPNDAKGCELFGFDILIDEDIRPWLIEVNFAPSVSCDTATDILVKPPLIRDYIDACAFEPGDGWRGKKPVRVVMAESSAAEASSKKVKRKMFAEPSIRKTSLKKTNNPLLDQNPVPVSGSPRGDGPVIRLSAASILRAKAAAAKRQAHTDRSTAAASRKASFSSPRKFVTAPSPSIRKEAPVRQSDRELPVGMRKRIGNFTRIFPFNDVTYTAASGLRKRFDMRKILSEIKNRETQFKAIPQADREAASQTDQMTTPYFFPIENETVHGDGLLPNPRGTPESQQASDNDVTTDDDDNDERHTEEAMRDLTLATSVASPPRRPVVAAAAAPSPVVRSADTRSRLRPPPEARDSDPEIEVLSDSGSDSRGDRSDSESPLPEDPPSDSSDEGSQNVADVGIGGVYPGKPPYVAAAAAAAAAAADSSDRRRRGSPPSSELPLNSGAAALHRSPELPPTRPPAIPTWAVAPAYLAAGSTGSPSSTRPSTLGRSLPSPSSRYVTVYPDAKVPEPVTVQEITLAPGIKPHNSPEPFVNLGAFGSDDDSEAETLFV